MSDSRKEFETLVGPSESLRVMESLKRGASRRDVLKMLMAGGMQAALAGSLAGTAVSAYAQTPRRGGRIRVAAATAAATAPATATDTTHASGSAGPSSTSATRRHFARHAARGLACHTARRFARSARYTRGAPHLARGAPGRIGIIAPVSRPFCGACSRLRITADGKVRPCLFSHDEWDLRPVLRAGASDADVASFLVDALWTKQAGHGIGSASFEPPARTMSAIGG